MKRLRCFAFVEHGSKSVLEEIKRSGAGDHNTFFMAEDKSHIENSINQAVTPVRAISSNKKMAFVIVAGVITGYKQKQVKFSDTYGKLWKFLKIKINPTLYVCFSIDSEGNIPGMMTANLPKNK